MVVSEIPSKQGKCHQKFANANKNSVHKFATLQTYLCLKLIKVWHHALEWGGQRTFSVLSTIPHILYIFCGMLWWTFYDGGQWYTVGATIFGMYSSALFFFTILKQNWSRFANRLNRP